MTCMIMYSAVLMAFNTLYIVAIIVSEQRIIYSQMENFFTKLQLADTVEYAAKTYCTSDTATLAGAKCHMPTCSMVVSCLEQQNMLVILYLEILTQ